MALREGHVVTLRPAHRSDKNALQRFFATLALAAPLRWVHQLPDAMLRAFTTQVSHQHVALVAMADTHRGPRSLVAEARCVVDKPAPGHAEFALTVADRWQGLDLGLGLGRALPRRLATHAAREGLEVLDGSVLAGNEPMLALLRGLGAILHSEGSGLHATLAL